MVPAGKRRLRVEFRSAGLELLAGHDGFLRGHPEPAIVAIAYHAGGPTESEPSRTQLVTRRLFRFSVGSNAPTLAAPIERRQPRARPLTVATGGAVIVLLVAIEEDSGEDLRRLYEVCDRADDFLLWPLDGREVVPQHLEEIANLAAQSEAVQVGVRGPDGPPIDTFSNDDYIGSAALWVPTGNHKRTADITATIRSRDRRNHWVVSLRVAIR